MILIDNKIKMDEQIIEACKNNETNRLLYLLNKNKYNNYELYLKYCSFDMTILMFEYFKQNICK